MNKFVVSASLATVAVNAFASIEQKVNVSASDQADAEMVAAIDAAFRKREVAQSVSQLYSALMVSLSKDGRSLGEQFRDKGVQLAWSNDSTYGEGLANCYHNCYDNCHTACHGSRGWR